MSIKTVFNLLITFSLITNLNILLVVYQLALPFCIALLCFLINSFFPSLCDGFSHWFADAWWPTTLVLYFSGSATLLGQLISTRFFPVSSSPMIRVFVLFLLSLPMCIWPIFTIIHWDECNPVETHMALQMAYKLMYIMMGTSFFWACITGYDLHQKPWAFIRSKLFKKD